MPAPNQIISSIILQYKGKTYWASAHSSKYFYVFVLGNGTREVPVNWRCFQLETIDAYSVPWPGMRSESRVINMMSLLVSENMR